MIYRSIQNLKACIPFYLTIPKISLKLLLRSVLKINHCRLEVFPQKIISRVFSRVQSFFSIPIYFNTSQQESKPIPKTAESFEPISIFSQSVYAPIQKEFDMMTHFFQDRKATTFFAKIRRSNSRETINNKPLDRKLFFETANYINHT